LSVHCTDSTFFLLFACHHDGGHKVAWLVWTKLFRVNQIIYLDNLW